MPEVPNIYSSCYDLSLKRFLRCLCDNDLAALNKKGHKNGPSVLSATWVAIYEEYVLLMNQKHSSPAVSLAAEIERLSYRYLSIIKALGVLDMTRDDDLVSMLHSEGFRFKFNSADRASYRSDIAKARRKAEDIAREIREKKAVLQQITGSKEGGEAAPIGRQFFVDNLVALSKHNKFQIRDNVTVAEYITFVSQMIKDFEDAKKKQNGR